MIDDRQTEITLFLIVHQMKEDFYLIWIVSAESHHHEVNADPKYLITSGPELDRQKTGFSVIKANRLSGELIT